MSDNSGASHRTIALVTIVALGIALVGFLRGVREPPPVSRPMEFASSASAAPKAVRYNDLPFTKLSPQQRSTLETLKRPDGPGLFEQVTRTEEMKLLALADRAKHRAFDGAPPTIPHGIDQMTSASCLVCHAEGVKVVDRVASKISHPPYTNCTQCHVEATRPELADHATGTLAESPFAGAYRAGPGTRATLGAPPAIPHSTWFRQECMSCHGLLTRPGTRTTHPWLTNCTQCHAPSAALDQVAFPEDKP
jgi:cytochrome c-type protein NapB